MITSANRIMASTYRNNMKSEKTNFQGRKIQAKPPRIKTIDEAACGSGGFFSALTSLLTPTGHVNSGVKK